MIAYFLIGGHGIGGERVILSHKCAVAFNIGVRYGREFRLRFILGQRAFLPFSDDALAIESSSHDQNCFGR